ncbi:MAG: lipopolysaccharide biosynthesis protein RfbH [Chloroflexota bacterium]|nr:MAG: lipopolysaccharide biosynthesis protein RfbH [Chloroflexota bacterium]
MSNSEDLRRSIMAQVTDYYRQVHEGNEFVPGTTRVQYAGRVFDERELQNMVGSVLDFWLTAGPEAERFEEKLGGILGVREVIPVNAGSSANLVAISALCSNRLRYGLRPGDEVIVPAASFPTTVNPIIQNRLIPVFIDSRLGDYNLDPEYLEAARSERTRAVMFAHTLGNPADLDAITEFVRKHNLYLVEDCCDALGSTWDGKQVGTYGHFGTLSFYPAHHITTGEGGAAFTSSRRLAKLARSVRVWGRDWWCGFFIPVNGICGLRFERQVPGMPGHYDHRYFYAEIGYNLKLTDPQAAIGLAQLEKLPDFVGRRKVNFAFLYEGLTRFTDYLALPEWHEKADPSWFAMPVLVRDEAPFTRYEITRYLESHNIETRPLFAGNILKQPAYQSIDCRVVGDMSVSDQIMRGVFFIGVYPGLDMRRLEYMVDVLEKFFREL